LLLRGVLTIRNFNACFELTIPVETKGDSGCDLSSSEPLLQPGSASSPPQHQQHPSAQRLSARQKISSSRRSRAGIALGYGARASSRMSAVNKAKETAADIARNAVAVIVRK
jgi:hypothetical protein